MQSNERSDWMNEKPQVNPYTQVTSKSLYNVGGSFKPI